jgi:hypothetical protein
MSDPAEKIALNETEIDRRILFHDANEIMEVSFDGVHFEGSADVNAFYDRIEERIAQTGQDLWFFLVNYSGARIDNKAWVAFSRRGKALNMAHSQGSVRFDASEITRRQIERAAGTEAFDPNLFADRDAAFARLGSLPSKRRAKIVQEPNHTREEIARRLRFLDAEQIMEVDFNDFTFHHSRDVDDVYDFIEEAAGQTEGKWYFLVNYQDCKIMPEAWVRYATRGKRLNEAFSLGSVRYAPGSETETDIRLRAESQGFRPNIRNSREEAVERIEELKAQNP